MNAAFSKQVLKVVEIPKKFPDSSDSVFSNDGRVKLRADFDTTIFVVDVKVNLAVVYWIKYASS